MSTSRTGRRLHVRKSASFWQEMDHFSPAIARTKAALALQIHRLSCSLTKLLIDPACALHCCLIPRSEEHTSELQSRGHLVCRLLLEIKLVTLASYAIAL